MTWYVKIGLIILSIPYFNILIKPDCWNLLSMYQEQPWSCNRSINWPSYKHWQQSWHYKYMPFTYFIEILCKFTIVPSENHWTQANQLLCYIQFQEQIGCNVSVSRTKLVPKIINHSLAVLKKILHASARYYCLELLELLQKLFSFENTVATSCHNKTLTWQW